MIDIKNLSFHFGLRTLFEDTSVMIQDGQKVGLVGPNGCGKSTLFKLIEGKFSPDGGKIDISRGTQIASVAQEIADPSVPLLDSLRRVPARFIGHCSSVGKRQHKLSVN